MKHTKSFKFLGGAALALLFASGAMAQSTTTVVTGSNQGSINNSVGTSATAGPAIGSSFSYGSGSAGSASTATISYGNTIAGGAPTTAGFQQGVGATLGGKTDVYNTGAAANTSTGSGAGSAFSLGSADAGANAAYGGKFNNNVGGAYGATGEIAMKGGIDSGSVDGKHGTDIGIAATTNTGGSAAATSSSDFKVVGFVGSQVTPTNGGQTIIMDGSVSDVKHSTSSASSGGFTFTGATAADNVERNGAVQNVHASSVVNANATFTDPSKR